MCAEAHIVYLVVYYLQQHLRLVFHFCLAVLGSEAELADAAPQPTPCK